MSEHLAERRPHKDILEVFANETAKDHGFLKVSAPMVRYSKYEFRKLLRQNGVNLCFTPMIIADSFNNSQKARCNEFTTADDDCPVIAQFAAQNAEEFSTATELIYPYVDGVDLNCGCPQSWAIAKGYGCGLLRKKPEILSDIIKSVRRRLSDNNFSVSIKIRLLDGDDSARSTVELARQMEKCGVTFLTIHGRTVWQRPSDSLNIPAMSEVKQSIQIPLVVNGNVRSWQDACDLYVQTQADGVMAASGLLSNPSLFNPKYLDCVKTPVDCIQQWLDIGTRAGNNIQFQCFHHHLTFMWSSHMKRKLRLEFNNFTRKEQIFDFFKERFNLQPTEDRPLNYTDCSYTHYIPKNLEKQMQEQEVCNGNSQGKFFNEFRNDILTQDDDIELDDTFLWN